MEPSGAISGGEWSSLSGMYTTEEADFMAQLLGNGPVLTELDRSISLGNSSTFWPIHESTMNMAGVNGGSYFGLEIANSSSYSFSQGSSYSSGGCILFPSSSSQESFYLSGSHPISGTNNNSNSIPMDFCVEDANNSSSYLIDQGDEGLNEEPSDGNVGDQSGGKPAELGFPVRTLQSKGESKMQAPEPAIEDKINNPSAKSKKKCRSTSDVQKNKRIVKSKKNQTTVSSSNNEEDNDNNNSGLNRQASSSCSSDDDSNASQDLNGEESLSMSSKGKADLKLNGKTRASRGSATDPQSLYARKRRERINERLRILQNLVPNGTKVDISTMLEEAVQYVKFLQLQIKLLSSDELWMYAPIAYNGMNIGLDHLKLAASKLT